MFGPRRRRIMVGLLLAAMNLMVPITHRVSPAFAATDATFCVEGLYAFIVTSSGSPGEVQPFRIASGPSGFIDFATTTAGPFSDPLEVNVTIGSNGAGQTRFIARGLAVGATTLNAINVDSSFVTNTLDVVVDAVDTIVLEPVDPAHALDADPAAPETGALRFFPDQDDPSSDATDSRSLKVKASLAFGSPNVQVDFRFADVDDPSTDTAPADPNGSDGVDNNGTGAAGASLTAVSAQTDVNGNAEVTVRLPMQPGDNVKLLATCAAGYANTLYIDGMDVRDGDDRALPTPAAEISPLVTTWRRLHIETDSQDPVSGNFYEGTITSARETRTRINGVRIPVTELKLGSMLGSDGTALGIRAFPKDQFAAGKIGFNGGSHQVLGSNRFSIYIAPGNAAGAGGAFYQMVEDDDLNGQLNGDDGFDVPLPDMGHLSSSDSASANWFAQAFIRPILLDGHDDLAFRVNGTEEPSDMYCKVLTVPCPAGQESFDHRATEASTTYWTVYLLGAYQPDPDSDGDPNAERRTGGRADNFRIGAALYAETIREGGGQDSCAPSAAAVHELAHVFGATHQSGLMADDCGFGTATFAAISLDEIRSAPRP